MPPDQTGRKGQKVPFGGGSLQDLLGRDAEAIANQGEFIH